MRKNSPIKEETKSSERENADIINDSMWKILKIKSIAELLRTQGDINLSDVGLAAEDIGNVGWLLSDMLDELFEELHKIDLRPAR